MTCQQELYLNVPALSMFFFLAASAKSQFSAECIVVSSFSFINAATCLPIPCMNLFFSTITRNMPSSLIS